MVVHYKGTLLGLNHIMWSVEEQKTNFVYTTAGIPMIMIWLWLSELIRRLYYIKW